MTGFEALVRDARHSLRTIARMPFLAAVVVISLGVGIGVNTAVFSWIEAILLRPLPGVADATGFHVVEPRTETGSYPGASWREYHDLRDRTRSFTSLIAFRTVTFTVGDEARNQRAYGQLVSGSFFTALGLRPHVGRLLQSDDAARPGGQPVVVVSHDFWQTHLGGVADPIGRTLTVNGRELTIVGVAPERFQGTVVGLSFDLWMPATLAPVVFAGSRELDDRGVRGYTVMGRLRPGATIASAAGDVGAAMRELAVLYPRSNAAMGIVVRPFTRATRGPQAFLLQSLMVLQAAMLLLLLAVCGNMATLVLARASARTREMGVRRALGAGRLRIASLLLTENVLLALGGAAFGAVLAIWGSGALRAVPMPSGLPIRFQTSVDWTGLLFAIALGITCGLLFGAAPALQLARLDPQRALRSGSNSERRSILRNTLVATQVALAMVVLVIAGLFIRRLGDARETDPGFRRDGVLLAQYDLSGRGLGGRESLAFAIRLLERLRALPNVEAASIAMSVPLDVHGMPMRGFVLEGRARSDAAEDQALSNIISPDYFRTMGIPVVAGRDFRSMDDATAAAEAVVNDAFVERYLGQSQPLGRRIRVGGRDYIIVGVVKTTRYESFDEPPAPIIHFSYRDRPFPSGQIHLLTRPGSELALAADLRRIVREIDPTLPVYDVRTLADHVDRNLVYQRIPARLFLVLGPLLLVIVAIGIYAVVAYNVARRTAEIGVRLALGATGGRIVGGVVRDVLRVVLVGTAVGWMAAVTVAIHAAPGRSLDPTTFVGIPLLVLLIAVLASWIPAQRAATVDPLVALRHE